MQASVIWRQVVSGTHNLSRKPIMYLGKKSLNGVWYNIVKVIPELEEMGITFNSLFELKIGSGANTLFWYDDWTGQGCLASRFPLLFNLDKRKMCFISERLTSQSPSWAWKKANFDYLETLELNSLNGVVSSTILSNRLDFWVSRISSDGIFHVRCLRSLIDSRITSPTNNSVVWIHLVPYKVVCFAWRACMDRIPTATALQKRKVHVNLSNCQLCDSGLDDTNHVLVQCPFMVSVLRKVFTWCGIPFVHFNSVGELIHLAAQWGRCPKKRKIFLAIIYGCLWCGWRARNDKIFNKVNINPTIMADNILMTVFSWVKYRGKFGNCIWGVWCCNPFNIL